MINGTKLLTLIAMMALIGCGGGGTSSDKNPVDNPQNTCDKTDCEKPVGASNIQATEVTQSSATIKWKSGSDNVNAPNQLSYDIYLDIDSNFEVSNADISREVTGYNSIAIDSLNANQTYYVKIRTSDTSDNSVMSETYSFKTNDCENGSTLVDGKCEAPVVVNTKSNLPVTGVTTCSTDTVNGLSCESSELGDFSNLAQDGLSQAGQKFSYTEITNDKDTCIEDTVTGLIWEKKNEVEGSLHNVYEKYTWYSSNQNTRGSWAGVLWGCESSAGCNTESFIKSLNDANYCGYSDWRLPTISELETLIDFSKSSPSNPITSAFIPNLKTKYWTATPAVNDGIYTVDFGEDAEVETFTKSEKFPIRAVRTK